MIWKHACRALLHLVLGLGASLSAHAQSPARPTPAADVAAPRSLEDRFDDAMRAYERNHWPQAFASFLLLASEGHADAARVVMLMHRQGPRLYGQHFVLTPSQWAEMARIGASPQIGAIGPVR